MVKCVPQPKMFEALGDRTRFTMVEMLLEREHTVSELAEPFSISLPAALKHLRLLEAAGLTISKKQGRERVCSLNPVPFDELRDWASMVRAAWNRRLDSLERYLTETAE